MIYEPQKRISERALRVWKISGVIQSSLATILCIAVIILTFIFDWPFWVIGVAIILTIIDIYLTVFFLPEVRWKRWRYEVREQEIELQRGVLIIKKTLVPMVRVQHVDTQQGPLLRKYHLASVTVSTAATTHEIPALDVAEAEELRIFISRLARVDEQDV